MMRDALLHDGAVPGGGDRPRQALQPITDSDQHIVDAAVLQLGEDLQPETSPLRRRRLPRSPGCPAPRWW